VQQVARLQLQFKNPLSNTSLSLNLYFIPLFLVHSLSTSCSSYIYFSCFPLSVLVLSPDFSASFSCFPSSALLLMYFLDAGGRIFTCSNGAMVLYDRSRMEMGSACGWKKQRIELNETYNWNELFHLDLFFVIIHYNVIISATLNVSPEEKHFNR
jgi:hypothetical protein